MGVDPKRRDGDELEAAAPSFEGGRWPSRTAQSSTPETQSSSCDDEEQDQSRKTSERNGHEDKRGRDEGRRWTLDGRASSRLVRPNDAYTGSLLRTTTPPAWRAFLILKLLFLFQGIVIKCKVEKKDALGPSPSRPALDRVALDNAHGPPSLLVPCRPILKRQATTCRHEKIVLATKIQSLLDSVEDGLGELLGGGGSLEVSGDGLSLGDDSKSGLLDVVGDRVELHVPWKQKRVQNSSA